MLDSVSRERKFLGRLEAPPEDRVREFVEANVSSGHAQFVAEEDGRILGWCDALPGSVSAGTAHVGHFGMGVHRAFRGRGIGRRLAEETIAKARTLGLEKIELIVYASNHAAIALYRSLGFVDEGLKVRGRLVDGVHDNVLMMALSLLMPSQSPVSTPAPGTSCARREPRNP